MAAGELSTTLKALRVFANMRANLATATSFVKRSVIEDHDYHGQDLGFLNTEPGGEQLRIHNVAVVTVQIALVQQALNGYEDLKRIKPVLEDPVLEALLGNLGDRNRLMRGMRIVRNGVFHVSDRPPSDDLSYFVDICNARGGPLQLTNELYHALYAFSEKVFLGELHIWPEMVYEISEEEVDTTLRGLWDEKDE